MAGGQRATNDELRGDLDALAPVPATWAKTTITRASSCAWWPAMWWAPTASPSRPACKTPPGKPDGLANAAIEAGVLSLGAGSAEITGRMSFADACRVMMIAVARDGEALARIVRGSAAGNAEGFVLQLLDVARIDTQRNQALASGRNAIIMGVEVDAYQRPQAYWLKDRADASTSRCHPHPCR